MPDVRDCGRIVDIDVRGFVDIDVCDIGVDDVDIDVCDIDVSDVDVDNDVCCVDVCGFVVVDLWWG